MPRPRPAEVSPIRVLLVDDEPLAHAGLRALLAGQPDLIVVAESLSGRDAVQRIVALRPDLVFLDVQMPRLDGFEVLREVMRQTPGGAMPHVVFVTAYDEFAVKAFDVQALDYLLKPVDEGRLREALRRVRASLKTARSDPMSDELARKVRALLDEYAGGRSRTDPRQGKYLTRVPVSIGARKRVVEVSDIDWIGARDYCAELNARGTSYVVRESLASLEERLDPARFVRIHRSAIVNLSRVTGLQRRPIRGTTVLMADGSRLPVSRGRQARLVELLGSPD